MSRRAWFTLAIVVAVIALVAELIAHFYAAAPKPQITVAGDVQSTIWTVSAPMITYPKTDYAAGVTTNTQLLLVRRPSGPSTATPTGLPVVSGRIAHMYVGVGDTVKRGQPVAQLDTAMLRLGVAQARANAARMNAYVRVLNDNLDTIQSGQSKLSTARAQLAKGAAMLATGQQQLTAGRAQLLAAKAGLEAGIRQIEAVINGPHPPPPAPWPPPQLVAQLKQLQAMLAKVNAALAQLPAAQAKLNQGKAQLVTGQAQLNTGAAQLSKAKRLVLRGRDVARIVARSQSILVKLAEYYVSQATIRASTDGVVTEARQAGTVAMVGAPIVRIRPYGPTKIDTYLTGQQLQAVPLGSGADIRYDSGGEKTLTGRVTLIGFSDDFPPTAFPTNIVHMTRAVKVTITLDDSETAPPGTPVDVVIHTNATR